ncbi:MAG: O-antigen polymerase [Desulfobacula sp. GWF2_41_7]|nr:MAG: O-antigen polymerase [Desulfobacula sp. GWF2_41_7]
MKIMFEQFDSVNRLLFVLLGFFIPVSTALTNVILGLIILSWMIDNVSDRFQRWVSILKSNPVAFMGLIVFLIHLAGIVFTDAEKDKIIESLMDGAKFLFISVAMIYFKDKKNSFAFWFSFALAMFITLILSYLLRFGMLPGFMHIKGGPLDSSVFLNHIAQNIFMAFIAFMAAVNARFAIQYQKKILWGVFSLLCVFNVLFMVEGRTGHLIAGVLFVYYFISWDRIKSFIIAGFVLLLIGLFAWVAPSNSLVLRAKTVIEEINAWEYGKPASIESSSGLRLEFYINSLKLIKNNPVWGTGTGSFEKTYTDSIKNTGMHPTDNPHNEYLMTTTQFGLIGLLALLCFFGIQWHSAKFFEDSQQTIISRGFVLTILFACMVSSPLVDHAEGWFFVFMSAVLFAGLDTWKAHGKNKMDIA